MVDSLPGVRPRKISPQILQQADWPAELRFRAFGVRIGIRATSQQILDRTLPALLPVREASRSPQMDRQYSLLKTTETPSPEYGGYYFLYGGQQKLAQAKELSPVVDALEADVNFYIAKTAQRWVFVHAGVVGWKGKAVLIPGRSFSGKTTLVKELLALGATYYSDEFAVFDSSGRVSAFPRRLCLRDPEKHQTVVTAKQLGARVGTHPLPLGLVVSARYRRGATWRPRLLSPGEATLELLANSLRGRSQPEYTLTVLARAISRGLALCGNRGEARNAAASILGILERARLI
jgi:hypothetical protein